MNAWLWSIAFAIGIAVVYGIDFPNSGMGIGTPETTMSRTASAIYGGFYKPAWALSVGWVIFACCRGYGGTKINIQNPKRTIKNFPRLGEWIIKLESICSFEQSFIYHLSNSYGFDDISIWALWVTDSWKCDNSCEYSFVL